MNRGLKDVDDSIVKVRNIVRYVRSSPARLQRFRVCAEKKKIPCKSLLKLDVPTRWNSTYLMLESTEKFQRVFELMQEDDGPLYCSVMEDGLGKKGLGPSTDDDWDTIRAFIKFLKLFYEVTLRMSGTKYATSSLYFEELSNILGHLTEYTNSDDLVLSTMAGKMMSKYQKYWGDIEKINRLLFMAAVQTHTTN